MTSRWVKDDDEIRIMRRAMYSPISMCRQGAISFSIMAASLKTRS